MAVIAVLSLAGPVGGGTSAAQSINLTPPTVLTPSTTGAQIGAVDPNGLNNPSWLKPVGPIAPPAGVNFVPVPKLAVPGESSTEAGTCAPYDSWCAYCAGHPSADLCEDTESNGAGGGWAP